MQTYIFTVAVTGEDVQDATEEIRNKIIDDNSGANRDSAVDVMVTDSVRVTE